MPVEPPFCRRGFGTAGLSRGSGTAFPVLEYRHAVTPFPLGTVHRGVGFFYDVFDRLVVVRTGRDSEARGRFQRSVFEFVAFHEQGPEAFGHFPRGFGAARVEID